MSMIENNYIIEMNNKDKIDSEIDELISLKIPVVLFGDVGKTFYLKKKFKNSIVIDSREISDFKNLSGYYAFKFGEIKYNNGVLIDSMRLGKTLIIKRIDLNLNFIYFLYSVIKYRTITNSLGEHFLAHKDFNLIFTSKDVFEVDDVKFIGPLSFSYEKIIENLKETVKVCVKNLISYVSKNKANHCSYSDQKRCGNICLLRYSDCLNDGSICFESKMLCNIHFRDLNQFISVICKIDKLNFDNRMIIYENFCNIFLRHDSEEVLTLLHLNQPPQPVLYEEGVARTYPFCLGVRNLSLNIKNRKHTLLIGETGAGKTSVVQYLARNSSKHFGVPTSLKIINMSSDFDGSDLVGGYCTLDIKKCIRDIYEKYKIVKPNTLDNFVLVNNLKIHLSQLSEDKRVNFEKEIVEIEQCLEKKVNIFYQEGLLIESMKEGGWVLLDEINLCNDETLNLIEALVSKSKITHFDSDNQTETNIHPNFRLFACMNPHGDHGKKKFDSYYFNHIFFYDFSSDIEDINLVTSTQLDCEYIGEYFHKLKSKIHSRDLVNRIEPLLTGRTLVRALQSIKLHPEIDKSEILMCLFLTQFNLQSKIIARNLMADYFHVKQHTLKKSFVDSDFILTPKVQMQLQDITMSIKLNYPILIQGDTSTGKTSIIYYLASKMNKNVLRINNHEHTESSDYLGTYVTTQNGIEFKESAFIKAIRNGDWVILDELNLAPSDVLEILNRLLDDNREIFVPQLNEVIQPHSEFRLFATQNLEYGGRKGLSKAFRNRFVEIFFEEKEEKEVLEILHLKTGLPMSFCKKMVGVYTLLKHQRNVNYFMTLRDLFRWANRVPRSIYEVFETGMSILYERQRSQMDRDTVLSVFASVFSDCEEIKKFNFVYKENACFDLTGLRSDNMGIIITKSVKKLITLLLAAIKCNETALIVGETGIGKTKVVNVISESIGNKLSTLNMHSGSESSDFIGSFTLKDGVIGWRNGHLVDAMIRGESFLIDEVNLAEDSVLERLNSLFESRSEIFIAEIEKNVKAHKNFRLFATMNPGNDFGKRELSPALRNRFTEIFYELDDGEITEIFREILKSKMSSSLLNKISKNVHLGRSFRSYEAFSEFIDVVVSKNLPLVKIKETTTEDEIIDQALALVGLRKDKNIQVDENNAILSVYPYYVNLKLNSLSSFNFTTETTRTNLLRILRAMVLKKGILLEGEPGVGKTSIVSNLAKILSKKCVRINLSEQTELSDLVGTYIPTERGVEFIPSEMTQALANGDFIILDEINLCTQSVIEGLNSVLDFRRTLFLPELTVAVHPETKIFATMNPCNSSNGRKILPRSFRDRFVAIYMAPYTEEDIRLILARGFSNSRYFANCSLRENLRRNILGDYSDDHPKRYEISKTSMSIGCLHDYPIKHIPTGYTIIHSQIKSLEKCFISILKNLPVILSRGIGKNAMIKFICQILNLEIYDFICHKDIDTSDLLGQYHKADNGEFKWMDSGLVEALKTGKAIVLHNPELVEKSIFDRLNSVFENEKVLNVYEKGIDGNIKIHPNTRLVLISNNPCLLSPALLDRCVSIELSSVLNSMDLWKIFYQSPLDFEKLNLDFNEESLIKNELIFEDENIAKRTKSDIGLSLENWIVKEVTDLKDLEMHLKRLNLLGIRPSILKQTYKGVFNTLIEEEIDAFFEYNPRKILFDERKIKHINSYRNFVFDIPRGKTEIEKLKNIESCPGQKSTRRSLMFLKNVWSLNKGPTPRTSQDFKKSILKSLKELSFKDYERIQEISERVSRVDFEISLEFDMTYFEMLMNIDEDPLEVYKNYLQYEMMRQEDACRVKIYKELKKIYKYGEGKIEHLLGELESITRKYDEEINQIEAKLPRDYSMFKTRLMQVDFENYKASEETQLFFDDFSDVFDYFLLYLAQYDVSDSNNNILSYKDYLSSLLSVNFSCKIASLSRSCSYESLCAYLLSTKNIEILRKVDVGILGHNLSSLLYGFMIGSNVFSPVSLVLEALNSDQYFELDEITGYEFDASLLNECLRTAFKPKKVGYLIERRNEICVDNFIGNSPHVESLSITSTPMQILKKLENDLSGNTNLMNINEQMDEYSNTIDNEQTLIYKSIKSLRDELTKYFKNSLSCTWLPNYTYFPYLFSRGLVDGERFFLDSLVYEFYDKSSIAESYALRISDNFFYNTVLQYKAFEIEKAVEKKIKDSQSKIRKDPKLFKKIHEDLMSYLGLPVTKVLEITFDRPSCQCGGDLEKNQIFTFLINQNGNKESCFCEKWLSLADNFERKNIERQLSHIEETNRQDIVSSFYSRNPETKFSYEEICLSKVINRLTDDPTHLKLVNAALKNPSPAFLFFVFQFAEEKVEYEDGTGIKGGTGEKNISDQIKEEDEISDEYNEENGKEEEEGVDFENQGDISTCSEDEASEVGVEESKDNEDKEEESENEEDKNDDKESNEEDLDNNNEELVDDNEQINLINEEDASEDSEDDDLDEDGCKEEGNDESNDKEIEDMSPRGFENEYIYKEQQLNQNQTADKAEDYDRKVFGENQTEEALCEGEGDQQAQGNEETGEAYGIEPTVNFKYKNETSTNLTLLLQSIFEANSANKYKGDFKSGRKLNMKKIIPYIASDYRRDKIWMKRRKSDKKDYTVRLFVDNSKSMYSQAMIDTLFVTFSRLTNAFKTLGIPVEIYRFGSDLVECTLQEMNFSDSETNIEWIDQFRDGINIILTDGVFQKTSFYNENFLVILIDRSGIKKMSKISLCDGNIFVQKYLDQFQLKYCTIENVEELEGVFVLALSELIKNK